MKRSILFSFHWSYGIADDHFPTDRNSPAWEIRVFQALLNQPDCFTCHRFKWLLERCQRNWNPITRHIIIPNDTDIFRDSQASSVTPSPAPSPPALEQIEKQPEAIDFTQPEITRKRWKELTFGENLAAGKRVVFNHVPNYKLTKDENDPYDLTNGKLSIQKNDRIWFKSDSVGWTTADTGLTLLIDLENSEPIRNVVIRLLGGKEQGSLVFPSEIEVIASEDGKTFHTIAKKSKVTFSEKEEAENNPEEFFYLPEEGKAYMEPFHFPVHLKARYIGFILTAPHGFLFSDELAVIKADAEQKTGNLSAFPERNIVSRGVAMLPRQPELFISSNVVTPNWFYIHDLREKKTPVTFTIDLPEGISLKTNAGIARKQSHLKQPNHWVLTEVYQGKQPPYSDVFGPFYFEIQEGAVIPENATAVITPEDIDSVDNIQVIPIRVGKIPEVPKLTHLDVSLGWMEDKEPPHYPDFYRSFAAMGFNTVSTFPRNHRTPEAREWLDSFVAEARANHFKVLYNESPFHVMWRVRKEEPELLNQLSSGPGKNACPSYTGQFYQEEIERIATIAKRIHPDFVFFDIEFWHGGAREAENCRVCQKAFSESKLESWEQFLISLGTRMQRDLQKAIAGTAPDGSTPVSGNYSANVQNSPYHLVHDIRALYPEYVDLVQPSVYNRGNVRATHERIRDNENWMQQRDLIPWLTPATYGTYPPHRLEQVILEAVLNGSRGITYYSFWDFDPIHFYYHSRALSRLAPYQQMLRKGKRITVTGSSEKLLYSSAGNHQEALVLISNDGKVDEITDIQFPDQNVKSIQDTNEPSVQIPSLEKIKVPADGQRLFHVIFETQNTSH